MSDDKKLRRLLAELESSRADALEALDPGRLRDEDLERLSRIQLAIQAIRDVVEGERKRREFDEWLQRADEE